MIQVTIKNDRNENLEDATFSLSVENMPIESARIVAEKLPAMIQKAFQDYADCKVGFNRDNKSPVFKTHMSVLSNELNLPEVIVRRILNFMSEYGLITKTLSKEGLFFQITEKAEDFLSSNSQILHKESQQTLLQNYACCLQILHLIKTNLSNNP